MNPEDLQSDCCKACFMLNDILDGMHGRFDYDGLELRRKFKGENFLVDCFIPKCMDKFLERRRIKTQFTAVETVRAESKAASTLSSTELGRMVYTATLKGMDVAKDEFLVYSAALMPVISKRLATNKSVSGLLQSVKIEQKHYANTRKLRNIDEESMLASLVITARDLAEALASTGRGPIEHANQLRDAHGGIQYCIEVPRDLTLQWRGV